MKLVHKNDDMESLPIKQIVEGAIMAAEQPLSVDQLMQLFEGNVPERSAVREAIKEIQAECEGRGFELKQVASGYRFQVKTDYSEWVSRLWKEKPPRYTRALLETLALIAYKQPITRGDIEEIRGVAVSTNIIRTLLEREWIRIVGHRDVPGHPALLATTKSFLDYFNLRSLDELPSLAEIKDLTKVNEELDLQEDLIEARILEVDEADSEVIAGIDDADLDAVSDQVNTIQENIRSLFAEDEIEEDDLDDALEEEPSADKEPSADGEKPSASAEEEPSADSEKPSAGEEPSADSEKPSADSEKPSAGEEPSATVTPITAALAEPTPQIDADSDTDSSAESDPDRDNH